MIFVRVCVHSISLNHCNNILAVFSKLTKTFEILRPVQYGVSSSAYFAIRMLQRNKKRSRRNLLNNKGISIDPCGTPNKLCIHSL